ncbi:CopY/TcrY family copper transport repressor [Vagococcus zengguangii]|uniref:CopY/TcrY family copper transport repressor n=1 Tax=Vagococcus zengguangii TaxID=2571750 RepID=A0A4D7CVG6_9ENTE|nr:CopY/TcrY family copper transport repressor [Vagococcus zengguangii]QCI86271.1 CopY/TcrY family copper transport repressor [Vagococcus zengguangii]
MDISEAEWEIMRVIWANGHSTSSDILTILSKKTSWKASTIKTLLSRLVQKDYLVTSKVGNKFVYRATVSENVALNHKMQHIVKQVCAKKRGQILGDLLAESKLTQHDIHALQQLLMTKLEAAPTEIACDCIPGQCTCHL